MSDTAIKSSPPRRRPAPSAENGSVLVIAVVFIAIFAVMSVALYWLINSQVKSTELERIDLKSFNVAEAGIDAGMLALKLAWPDRTGEQVSVDDPLLKEALQAANPGLWDPSRSSPSEFIEVSVYDNSDSLGRTVTVPPENPAQRVYYDANVNADGTIGDGKMYIDATANVDDDRHRILILAEMHRWDISFAPGLALWAGVADSNGQGLEVCIESGTPPVYYDVHETQHKGVDPGPGVQQAPHFTSWESIFNPALHLSLLGAAKSAGTYFTDENEAEDFLTSADAYGSVVYLKTDGSVNIGGNSQIGTVEKPVVVVVDAPDGSEIGWDMKGTADFYGVLVVIGDCTLRGTCGIHGALYTEGTVQNKGNGNCGEIQYNDQVLKNIRAQYVMSVNIVPNTWEEYTLPRTSTTVTGP
jgi:hypothetical protein